MSATSPINLCLTLGASVLSIAITASSFSLATTANILNLATFCSLKGARNTGSGLCLEGLDLIVWKD